MQLSPIQKTSNISKRDFTESFVKLGNPTATMYTRLLIMVIDICQYSHLQAQTPVPYGENKAAGHYVDTRGFRIYYESYGKGEPLLLMHTNGASIKIFENHIPYFSQHYRVIAVDSRAKGRSVDAGDSLTFEMMADDFNALLDTLHLDSCYVIGWSDGGDCRFAAGATASGEGERSSSSI